MRHVMMRALFASQRVVFTASPLLHQTCTFGICSTKMLPLSDMDKIDATDPASSLPRIEKRQLEAVSQDRNSDAAELNRRILRKLQKTFVSDPEADLLSLFPTKYLTVLAALKEPTENLSSTSRHVLVRRQSCYKLLTHLG